MRTLVVVALALAACGSSTPVAPAGPSSSPSSSPPKVAPAPADAPPTPSDDELALPNRALTGGEIALLRPLFSDSIDYARVRVIDNTFPLQPENVYMTPRGHVYAPGPLWERDFSKASVGRRAVFVHEMTHVWQHANGMDLVGQGVLLFTKYRGNYERAYPYQLEPQLDLVDYGMEQQASIVEDYFLINVERSQPLRMTNAGLSTGERDRLYATVLAKLLGNARYAKELSAADVAAKHAVSSDRPPGKEACKESETEHGAAHMCSWRYQPHTPN